VGEVRAEGRWKTRLAFWGKSSIGGVEQCRKLWSHTSTAGCKKVQGREEVTRIEKKTKERRKKRRSVVGERKTPKKSEILLRLEKTSAQGVCEESAPKRKGDPRIPILDRSRRGIQTLGPIHQSKDQTRKRKQKRTKIPASFYPKGEKVRRKKESVGKRAILGSLSLNSWGKKTQEENEKGVNASRSPSQDEEEKEGRKRERGLHSCHE